MKETETKKSKHIFKEILSWVGTFAGALVLAFLINFFIIRPSEVSGASMQPSFKTDDMVFLSKLPYIMGDIQCGDIVVIDSEPQTRTLKDDVVDTFRYNLITKKLFDVDSDKFWIKRVIGCPGDTIEFIGSDIYRNGELLEEDYILDKNFVGMYPAGKIQLGSNEIYVMGDNRGGSSDSRVIGPVNIRNIIGKVVFTDK